MMPDPPHNITIEPGRIEVKAATAEAMLEVLVTLAMIMQNDLERLRAAVELSMPAHEDAELLTLLGKMRRYRLFHTDCCMYSCISKHTA